MLQEVINTLNCYVLGRLQRLFQFGYFACNLQNLKKKYPSTLSLPDGGDKIVVPMKKLNFDGIQEVVLCAFDMVASNQWTQVKAKYYLQIEGINTINVEHCVKSANNHFKLNNTWFTDPDYDKLYQQHTDHPEKFEITNISVVLGLYNTVDIQIFVDACMHFAFTIPWRNEGISNNNSSSGSDKK